MKKPLVLVSALAALLSVSSANALIIDDFTIGQADITLNGPSTSSLLISGPSSNIIGGYRQTEVTMYSGGSDAKTEVRVTSIGVLDISNTTTAQSRTVLTWNANGAGLGNLDLLDFGSNGIFLAFPYAMDHALDLMFEVEDTGNSTSTFVKTYIAGSQGNDFFVPFSAFDSTTALSSADAIRMTIDSTTAGLDATIDLVESRDAPPGSVPEPATMGLLGLGLLGLGLTRLKAKTRNA
jgi:hypothetical protein